MFQTPSERAVRRCAIGILFFLLCGDVSNPFRAGGEALRACWRVWPWAARVSNPFRAGGEALEFFHKNFYPKFFWFQTPSERAVRRCGQCLRKLDRGHRVSNPFRAGGEALWESVVCHGSLSRGFKPLQSGR